MAFFAGLLSIFALLRGLGWLAGIALLQDNAFDARVAAAVMFTLIGVSHFARPQAMQYMVEGLLPAPRLLVLVSGAAEVLLGLGLLYPPTQRLCAWGLLALLVVIFPANVNVAVRGLPPPGGLPAQPWYVWSRLAFQPVYMAWVWYAALSPAMG